MFDDKIIHDCPTRSLKLTHDFNMFERYFTEKHTTLRIWVDVISLSTK